MEHPLIERSFSFRRKWILLYAAVSTSLQNYRCPIFRQQSITRNSIRIPLHRSCPSFPDRKKSKSSDRTRHAFNTLFVNDYNPCDFRSTLITSRRCVMPAAALFRIRLMQHRLPKMPEPTELFAIYAKTAGTSVITMSSDYANRLHRNLIWKWRQRRKLFRLR